MSLFAMQLANAFSSRELSNSQSLLKNSIHKLSSGKRLVKSRDDAGMLSVQMKMKADSYQDASTMGQIGNAVSFLDTQDGMLNNAQNILTRMSQLKGLSTNDPMRSELDIDSYNNEFHDLQKQQYQPPQLFSPHPLECLFHRQYLSKIYLLKQPLVFQLMLDLVRDALN